MVVIEHMVVVWRYIKKVLFVREKYSFSEIFGNDLALCRKIVSWGRVKARKIRAEVEQILHSETWAGKVMGEPGRLGQKRNKFYIVKRQLEK